MTDTTTTTNIESAESIETSAATVDEIVETYEEVGVETFPEGNSNLENTVYTLPMMGKGMLGIFIVTVIIIAAVAILNKVTSDKKD